MNNITPFIGLRSFSEEERDIYKGYSVQYDILRHVISRNYVSLLVGSSASGKSSFIKAFFIPEFTDGYIVRIEPGENRIFQNLGEECGFAYNNSVNSIEGLEKFYDYLFESEIFNNKNTILIIDQFEEIFTRCSLKERLIYCTFIDRLPRLFDNVRILLCGRVDYLNEYYKLEGLTELISGSTVFLPKLPRERIREAIEEPLNSVGKKIDSVLTDLLLNKVCPNYDSETKKDPFISFQEDDSLGLLQYYLFQLWNNFSATEQEFTTDHYLRLGPFEKIIDRACDDLYYFPKYQNEDITDRKERHMTKFMFQYISKQDKFNTKKTVRNPKTVEEIREMYNSVFHSGIPRLFNHDNEDIETKDEDWVKLIEKYDNPIIGILKDHKKEGKIDVMHEAVFRQWFRCNRWIKQKIKLFDGFQSLIENENKHDYNEKLLSFNDLVNHWEFLPYYESQFWREEFFEYLVSEDVKTTKGESGRKSKKEFKLSAFYKTFVENEVYDYNPEFVSSERLYRRVVQRLYRQRYLQAIKRADFYTLLYVNHYKERVKKDWKFQLSDEEINLREFDKEFYFALDLDCDPGKDLVKNIKTQSSDSSNSEEFNENSNLLKEQSELISESDYKSIVLRWYSAPQISPKILYRKAYTDPSESGSHAHLYEFAAFGGNIEYLKALLAYVYECDEKCMLYNEKDRKTLAEFFDRQLGNYNRENLFESNFQDPGIAKIGTELSAFSRSLFGNQVSLAEKLFNSLRIKSEKVKALLHRSSKNKRTIFHTIASNSEQLSKYLIIATELKLEYVDEELKKLEKELGDVTENQIFKEIRTDVITNQNRENIPETVKRKNLSSSIDIEKANKYFGLVLDAFELKAPLERLKDNEEWLPIHTSAFPIPNYSNTFSHLKGALLETNGKDGGNVLFWACLLNNLEAVKELLKLEDKETVRKILSVGNHVDFYRKNYLYALMRDNLKSIGPYVVVNKLNYQILSFLISEQIENIKDQLDCSNGQDNGLTILHYFCRYSFDFVKILLKSGANPNLLSDQHGPYTSDYKRLPFRKYSPLDYAIIYGDLNIVKLFFSTYCEEKVKDKTIDLSMVTAFEMQSREIYDFLKIKGGKHVNLRLNFDKSEKKTDLSKAEARELIHENLNHPWSISPLMNEPKNWGDEDICIYIENDLLINELREQDYFSPPNFAGVRSTLLSFYPEQKLLELEIQFPKISKIGYLTFLMDGNESNIVRLNGTSPPIHELNAKVPIKLTQKNVFSYLKFFCTAVHGEEGAFKIIDKVEDILWIKEEEKRLVDGLIKAVLNSLSEPIQESVEEEGNFWLADALVNYGNALFWAQFKVQSTGMVGMVNDQTIVSGLAIKVEVFENGLRTLKEILPKKNERITKISFFETAEAGLLDIMKYLYRLDPDVINKKTKKKSIKTEEKEKDKSDDVYGKTALRIAVEKSNVKIINWLLSLEGLKDLKASDKKNAMQVATEIGNNDIINLLNSMKYAQ